MTTREVAERYYELATQHKWTEIIDTYYDDEIECIEPPNSKSPPYTKGKSNVRVKAIHFEQMIAKVYHVYTTNPIVAGNKFCIGMGMDFDTKQTGRMRFDEFGIFTVEEGKIIREEFVLHWNDGPGHEYNV